MSRLPGYIGAVAFTRSGYPDVGWYDPDEILKQFGCFGKYYGPRSDFPSSILERVYPECSGTSASGECHAACAKLPYRFPFCRRLSDDLNASAVTKIASLIF